MRTKIFSSSGSTCARFTCPLWGCQSEHPCNEQACRAVSSCTCYTEVIWGLCFLYFLWRPPLYSCRCGGSDRLMWSWMCPVVRKYISSFLFSDDDLLSDLHVSDIPGSSVPEESILCPVGREGNPFSSHDSPVNDMCAVLDTCRIPTGCFFVLFLLSGRRTKARGPFLFVFFCFVLCCVLFL